MSRGGALDAEEARLRRELERIKERWLEGRKEDVSFLREAVYDQYNLITVLGLGGLTLASAVVAPPFLPLFASALLAWEVAWLGIAPNSPRFRRSVRARQNADALAEKDRKRCTLVDKLPPALKRRYEAAQAIAREVREHAETAERGELDALEDTIAKLDYLLEECARMLVALDGLAKALEAPEADTIDGRVAAVEREVEGLAPGKLRQAKEKNLLVLRQRAERYARSREEREYLQVSLDTLENTLKLVRDQVVAATSISGIASSLDQVVLEVGRHREYMDEVEHQLRNPVAAAPLSTSGEGEALAVTPPLGTPAAPTAHAPALHGPLADAFGPGGDDAGSARTGAVPAAFDAPPAPPEASPDEPEDEQRAWERALER